MEAADVAFRADRTGWAYWSRDGGTFYVLRFSWHTAANRNLTSSASQLRCFQLDQQISMGTIGDRFAVKRELAQTEHDPTTRCP